MNIDYFFSDDKKNKSIKTLFREMAEKKSDFILDISKLSVTLQLGFFSFLIFGVLTVIISFGLQIFNNTTYLKEILVNHYGKILLLFFFFPTIVFLFFRIFSKLNYIIHKKAFYKKMNLFYKEDEYIPILKKLDIIHDSSSEGKNFIINLNNKELTYSNIEYIMDKYQNYYTKHKKLQEIEILNNVKNKVLNSENQKTDGNKNLNFFK